MRRSLTFSAPTIPVYGTAESCRCPRSESAEEELQERPKVVLMFPDNLCWESRGQLPFYRQPPYDPPTNSFITAWRSRAGGTSP